jgi:DNA modification methylase
MRKPAWRILPGDVREQLRAQPSNHYHVVVTSPPYWQQRDYEAPGQLGLEPTLGEYIATLVDVFREVRRVLRPDGTFWLNIGDKRAAGKNAGARGQGAKRRRGPKEDRHLTSQLLGIPWRLALALQDDGWQLRNDCIWHKPNPMPGSAKRRLSDCHEYMFLFSKEPGHHFDPYAIMEPVSGGAHSRGRGINPKAARVTKSNLSGRQHIQYAAAMSGIVVDKRLPRDVWTISTHSFRGGHFAAYPPALVERALKASTSEAGCCSACGRPWVREVKRERYATRPGRNTKVNRKGETVPPGWTGPNRIGHRDPKRHVSKLTTVGFKPACSCGTGIGSLPTVIPPAVPCRALDPFLGSGTTIMVANRLGIDSDGIELSREYAALAFRRVTEDAKPKPAKRKRA